jgi:hypothetical protein
VQAGSLEIGERLQTLSGDVKVVQQKLPRPGPQPVFNLEVHDEHVYFVSEDGVLVHKAGPYNGDLDGTDDFADVDFVGQKIQGRKLGIDTVDNFPDVGLHWNRLDSPGKHAVYALREKETGRILHLARHLTQIGDSCSTSTTQKPTLVFLALPLLHHPDSRCRY